jgi:hypothetical protein
MHSYVGLSANCIPIQISLTYLRSWALLEELSIVQPLKNSPAFYGTRWFNTVFTKALHWSLSWAISIQSTPLHPILSLSYSRLTCIRVRSRRGTSTTNQWALYWWFQLATPGGAVCIVQAITEQIWTYFSCQSLQSSWAWPIKSLIWLELVVRWLRFSGNFMTIMWPSIIILLFSFRVTKLTKTSIAFPS